MSESRRADRVRSLLRAQVIFNKGASTIDCVVRNISDTGARLEIADSMALPAEFDLDIPHKGRVFRCRIVWRAEGLVGVTFHGDHKPGLDGMEFDAEERCAELMRENAKLKAQIIELKARLARLTEEA